MDVEISGREHLQSYITEAGNSDLDLFLRMTGVVVAFMCLPQIVSRNLRSR